MSKKEIVLKHIWDCMYGQEAEKEEIYDYICGVTQEEPEKANIRIFYYAAFLSDIVDESEEMSEEDREANKLIYKFIKFLSRKEPDVLIRCLCRMPQRYEAYKAAGVSEKFVENDFNYYIDDIFHYGLFAYQVMVIHIVCAKVLKLYPELSERLIKNVNSFSGNKQISTIFLIAEKAVSDSQCLDFLESSILSLMNKCFPHETVMRVLTEYDTQKICLTHLENRKSVKLNLKDTQNKDLLFYLCFLYAEQFCFVHEAYRMIGILLSPEYLKSRFHKNEQVWDYIEKFNLPDETILKQCAYILSSGDYDSVDRNCIKKVENILEKNTQLYFKTIDILYEENNVHSMVLLAGALKQNKLSEEQKKAYIEKMETIVILKLKEIYESQENDPLLFFEKEEMKNFEFLREENFSFSTVKETHYLSRGIRREIVTNSIYLLDYSIVACNTVGMFLKHMNKNGMKYDGFEFFMKYRVFCKDTQKSVYDTLYQYGHYPFETICMLSIVSTINAKEKEDFKTFLLAHKKEAEKGIKTFCWENENIISYLQLLYEPNIGFDWKALIQAFHRKAKSVINYLEKLLVSKENEVRPYIEELSNEKSKVIADAAMRLIRIWDNDKIETQLNKMTTIEELTEYIEKQYSKNNEKNIPFEKEIAYDSVHQKDSDKLLPEILTKYYVSEYILLKDLYVIKTCKKIEQFANPYEFRKLIHTIYELWLTEGAGTKYRNILFPFALTATEGQIIELKKQIDVWAVNSKPALAAFAVQCLCMNGSKMALLLTDTMAKKHKSKKVKETALEAMNLFAEEQKLSRDELDDLIVPDLGFGKDRKRSFTYGERSFTAVLNNNIEISLIDPSGKVIKSLPKASAKLNDDETKVAEAKEELKAIKKQLKTILDTQKPRIEKAIITGRRWSIEKWKALFIDNPLMTPFSMGIIWEEQDEKGTILKTFRYMEDGTFNTVEEEEYELGENTYIAPLHPCDISMEEVEQWKQQLDDYEIIQPVDQITLPIYIIKEDNREKTELDICKGRKVYGATFKSVAGKLGLGLTFSGSECDGCFYIDENTGVTMKIKTSSFYLGDYNCVTELDTIIFYKGEEKVQIPLGQVSAKLLSFAVYGAGIIIVKTVE